AGSDGLLIFDPSPGLLGAPVGVVASWPGDAQQVLVSGTLAIIRTGMGLETVDLADPLAPVSVGAWTFAAPAGLSLDGDRACLARADSLVVLDLADPAVPTLAGTAGTWEGHTFRAATLVGDGVDLASTDGLAEVDAASGAATWRGGHDTGVVAQVVVGDLLVQATGELGLQVWRRPAATYAAYPRIFTLPTNYIPDRIVGDRLVGHLGGDIVVYDLASATPTPVVTIPAPDVPFADVARVDVRDDLVVIGYGNGDLRTVRWYDGGWDELGSLPTQVRGIIGLEVAGNVLGVLTGAVSADSLLVCDITDPAAIRLTAVVTAPTLGWASRLEAVEGGFVAGAGGGSSTDTPAFVVDVRDPAAPGVASILMPAESYWSVGPTTLYVRSPEAFRPYDLADIGRPLAGTALSIDDRKVGNGSHPYFPAAYDFVVAGGWGYLVGTDTVFDLADPMAPVAVGATVNEAWRNPYRAVASADHLLYSWPVGLGNLRTYALLPAAGAAWPSGVDDGLPAPTGGLALDAAPNPFNPRVVLSFTMAAPGTAEIAIHDLRGRRVARLAGTFAAGPATLAWDGCDRRGRPLPSGVYLARLVAGGDTAVRKLLLAR
ncbi:MAG TPA: hypothetical protein PLQ13_05480, partial [Candidatus Krumholzibacteria bacterium]|nr:hypothetical protein [Candidatus Krumholzibacteria bacterium]